MLLWGDKNKRNLGWPSPDVDKLTYQSESSMPTIMGLMENTPIINGKSMVILDYKYNIMDTTQVTEWNNLRQVLKNLKIRLKYTTSIKKNSSK